jgi:hypothetical protein
VTDLEATLAAAFAPVVKGCPAALMIKGEHFPCDWRTDMDGRHQGWAHISAAAEAVWVGTADDESLPGRRAES